VSIAGERGTVGAAGTGPEFPLPEMAVPEDPALTAAVDDAVSGPELSRADPNRRLGADPHDFAGLYIRHRSSFGSQARRFLRDPRDVDEVVQEAFLRLFLALPELETELQALAYCRRTVTNLCIDRYRADKRRPKLVNIESLPPGDFPDEELSDPVVQAEDAAFVREALSMLTPLHREALVKREIEEKSIPVIAAELDVPEESVKHLLHRARRALRRHLAKTHLAPGADLEATSTLSLIGRSAAASGGRLGVVAVFLLLAFVSAKPDVTKTVLTSWPLGDLLPAVTHALAPEPQPKTPSGDDAARSGSGTLPAPVQGPALGTQPPAVVSDTFVGVAQATLAPTPPASPAAVSPSPSPASSPSGQPAPSPSGSSSASGSPSPSGSPSTSPSASGSPSPSGSPSQTSAKPGAENSKPRVESTPSQSAPPSEPAP